MIVAPTTMDLDVAFETMPLVSAVYIKTHVTLIIADMFNGHTSNIKVEIPAGHFKQDNPEVTGLTHPIGSVDSCFNQ